MPHTHPSFARLGLGQDADTRTVRRAYARELKQIDQERDAAGFQYLREAYELALAWAERMMAGAPAAQAPAPDSGRADPHDLCDLALAQYRAALPRLTQGRMAGDAAAWRREMQRILDGEPLVNICARTLFEEVMAHLLAAGWKPGHESLLPVAASLFDWRCDRARLLRFGAAGSLVDRAVGELALFNGAAYPELARRQRVLARLRAPLPPARAQLMRDLPWVEQMLERFPNLVALVVNPDALDEWRRCAQQRPAGGLTAAG